METKLCAALSALILQAPYYTVTSYNCFSVEIITFDHVVVVMLTKLVYILCVRENYSLVLSSQGTELGEAASCPSEARD